eukprot:gene14673-17794_t
MAKPLKTGMICMIAAVLLMPVALLLKSTNTASSIAVIIASMLLEKIMVKVLKLQKAVVAIVLGILALIAYKVMSINRMDSSIYLLEAAGLLFVVGALMFLYPILFGKKDKEGNVELDPEEKVAEETEGLS